MLFAEVAPVSELIPSCGDHDKQPKIPMLHPKHLACEMKAIASIRDASLMHFLPSALVK